MSRFTEPLHLNDRLFHDLLRLISLKNIKKLIIQKDIQISGIKSRIKNAKPENKKYHLAELCKAKRWIRNGIKNFFKNIVEKKDSDVSKVRFLKETAEGNKDHDSALYFHSLEMRAKRWSRRGIFASLLDFVFDVSCNYGQSIARPAVAFIISIIVFSYSYCVIGTNTITEAKNAATLLFYSLANNPLLLAFSRGLKTDVTNIMYGEGKEIPPLIDFIFVFQNLLSIVLLFLIVLGLRNRFRI